MESYLQSNIAQLDSKQKIKIMGEDIKTAIKQFLPPPSAAEENEYYTNITEKLDNVNNVKRAIEFAKWLDGYTATLKNNKIGYARHIETFLKNTKKYIKNYFSPKDEVLSLLSEAIKEQFNAISHATKAVVYEEALRDAQEKLKTTIEGNADKHDIEDARIVVDFLKQDFKRAQLNMQLHDAPEQLNNNQKKFILEFRPDLDGDKLVKFAAEHLVGEKQREIIEGVKATLNFLSPTISIAHAHIGIFAETKKPGAHRKESDKPYPKT